MLELHVVSLIPGTSPFVQSIILAERSSMPGQNGIDYSKWDRFDFAGDNDSDDEEEYRHEEESDSHDLVPTDIPDDLPIAERSLLSMGIPYEKDAADGWYRVGVGRRIKIHPDDSSIAHYSSVIFEEDPTTYRPDPDDFDDGDLCRVTKWGLLPSADKDDMMSFLSNLVARSGQPFLYEGTLKPEEQFVKFLEDRKLKYIEGAFTTELLTCTFVIKVELCLNEEDVWRRIRLPAAIDLSKLHDQVLVPAMGWSRGYHGYVFEDPRDGAVLGPSKYDGYIDMMHAPMHYIKVMDDRDFPLAGILESEGQYIHYTYDLGDQWQHFITLEEIIEGGDGEVVLLDGAGACPPEDGNGLESKSCSGYAQFLAEYKKNPKKLKMKEAIREVNRHATNYNSSWLGHPVPFRPLEFDIARHRMLMKAMLAGPSVKSRKGMHANFHDGNGPDHYRESFKGCDNCGDRLKALSSCADCGKAYYCSRECQVEHWKKGGHREACKAKGDKKKKKRKDKKKK